MTRAWQTALRRGTVPVLLGVVCLVLSWPVPGRLAPLLQGLGALLIVIGLIITVATARTLGAEEKRIGPRV